MWVGLIQSVEGMYRRKARVRKGSLCTHLFLTSADYCTVLLLITKARMVTCCIAIGD